MARGMGFSRAVLFLLVFAVALGVFVVVRHGVSARDQPTQAEIFVARRLRHLAIPMAARQMSSPTPVTPATIKAGMEHFADHCAICHANDGSGQAEMGRNLYPRSPDLRLAQTQQLTDGELFYIIENGVRLTGMPAWGAGGEHDVTDNWRLVHFIRHLPKLSQAEIDSMKESNPKSPDELRQDEGMRRFLEGGGAPAGTAAPPHRHTHGGKQ